MNTFVVELVRFNEADTFVVTVKTKVKRVQSKLRWSVSEFMNDNTPLNCKRCGFWSSLEKVENAYLRWWQVYFCFRRLTKTLKVWHYTTRLVMQREVWRFDITRRDWWCNERKKKEKEPKTTRQDWWCNERKKKEKEPKIPDIAGHASSQFNTE